MAGVTLTDNERLTLMRVQDLRLTCTNRSNPMLMPLSLYSSELKGTKQIAGSLDLVRKTGQLSPHERSRARYFISLSNQDLVKGTASAPILTPLASFYLDALDAGADEGFWQGNGGDSVELKVIRELVERLRTGQHVSEIFKLAWFNSQTFFDYVPLSELPTVLSDRNCLLSLFCINSNGWEIGRYFQLSLAEREDFDAIFAKVQPTARSGARSWKRLKSATCRPGRTRIRRPSGRRLTLSSARTAPPTAKWR